MIEFLSSVIKKTVEELGCGRWVRTTRSLVANVKFGDSSLDIQTELLSRVGGEFWSVGMRFELDIQCGSQNSIYSI